MREERERGGEGRREEERGGEGRRGEGVEEERKTAEEEEGKRKGGPRGRGGRWRRGGDTTPVTLHYILLFHRFLRSAIFLSREWNLLRYVGRDVPTCVPHVAYPCGYLSCSQSYGSFPSEMSVLEVEDELEWNPSVPAFSSMPLSIYDDGAILYYK